MVAVIKFGYSLRRTFLYNNIKVDQGDAKYLTAENYPVDVDILDPGLALNRLLIRAQMNSEIKQNSVHISLNFSPSDHLDPEKLKQIVDDYMKGIGFDQQPYLVFQHFDAGHPHVHIVTTNVQANGKGLRTYRIGKYQSEPTRKIIEEKYGLIKAEDQKHEVFQLEPVDIQKVVYGKLESKKAMNNILEHVINHYKFTSLPQLNAVLNLYNIHADRGAEGSKVFVNKGLNIRIMAKNGQFIGVPIKSSRFFSNPTLKNLEKRFIKNKLKKDQGKTKLKNLIDAAYVNNRGLNLQGLSTVLKQGGVDTILRHGENGRIFGVTFIDHRTKNVFNGSELGKAYSAAGLESRCNKATSRSVLQDLTWHHMNRINIGEIEFNVQGPELRLIDIYFQHEQSSQYSYFNRVYKWNSKKALTVRR